jgi:DNA ligase-1
MMGYTDKTRAADAPRYARCWRRCAADRADSASPTLLPGACAGRPPAEFERARPAGDWLVEWKYDGIRAQVVQRARADLDLVARRGAGDRALPEIVALAGAARRHRARWRDRRAGRTTRPRPFNLLQQRIGRKTLTKKILADAPVGFIAYDMLEWAGEDCAAGRSASAARRLEALREAAGTLMLSPTSRARAGPSWRRCASSRASAASRASC